MLWMVRWLIKGVGVVRGDLSSKVPSGLIRLIRRLMSCVGRVHIGHWSRPRLSPPGKASKLRLLHAANLKHTPR